MAEGGQPVYSGNMSSSQFSSVQRPGYAVFVVNIDQKGDNPENAFSPRLSAREDSSNLQTVFIKKLGLEWINSDSVEKHQNLGVGQWDHTKPGGVPRSEPKECCLCCHIKSLDHSKSKCFLLAISSHGRELTETEILFSDGHSITLTEIFDALSDERCPSMKGVPRVNILQVCRGNFKDQERVDIMQDRGVQINIRQNNQPETGAVVGLCGTDTMDNPQLSWSSETTHDYTLQNVALHKMPANFLLIYPAVSGQLTQCNEIGGSWLINAFKEVLESESNSQNAEKIPSSQQVNFFELLTLAAHKVALRETVVYKHQNGNNSVKRDKDGTPVPDEHKSGLKNTVCSHHRLTAPLAFYTKENLDNMEREALPAPTL